MNFQEKIDCYQKRINRILEECLPSLDTQPYQLHKAMRYSVCSGGKRIRPLLVYATGEALRIPTIQLDIIACSIELIHAYSLIHDDLPAMDNDDFRRGQLTCHKAFDEATAILAGDALQSLAFELIAQNEQYSAEKRVAIIAKLAQAIGSLGMAGGQSLDLDATGKTLVLSELEMIHRLKTGALIEACVDIPCVLNTLSSQQQKQLSLFASKIGLAFQIQDDILDIESPTDVLGKKQGADITQNKATYPQLLGLDAAKQKTHELLTAATQALEIFEVQGVFLQQLGQFIVARRY